MLTAQQKKFYDQYIWQLLEIFKKTDWDIKTVTGQPASSGCHAEIEIVDGQKRADLYLSPLFPYESVELQRHFMIHELMHAMLREMPDAITIAKAVLGEPQYAMLQKAHEIAEENVTDQLAGILAPLMPLPAPPWMQKKRRTK